jgi:hypothetical protein
MPRRPAKIPARECEIRGGEYVAWDRASYETSMKVWLPMANDGDPVAQTNVGEIYEKGLGVPPDYVEAAKWYRRAAESGNARAASNLGYLYEQGLGVRKDPAEAVAWYRRATGAGNTPFAVKVARPADGTPTSKPGGTTVPQPPNETSAAPKPPGESARPEAPPPTIEITEPELTMRTGSLSEIRVQPPIDRLTIAGRVSSSGGLKRVTLNGAEQRIDTDQRFRGQIPLRSPEEKITIDALDQAGRSATTSFVVRSRPSVTDSLWSKQAGSYHALVIGNEDYRVLPRLVSAVTDARLVAQTLSEQYGFKVTVLPNASRYDILVALNDLRQRLTDKDNLLIYYAGHANREENGHQGSWLPVDAETGSPGSWVTYAAITEFLSAMSVRQVLVATDSCHASPATRDTVVPDWDDDQARQILIQTLFKRRSRMLMTSGNCDAALASAGQPTPFTRSLVEILNANRDVLAGQEVFRLVRLRLASVERPEATRTLGYIPIRYAGHEAGDFFFVRPRS